MNQQIKTSIGVAIIIIFAITAGFFTWKAINVGENNNVQVAIPDQNKKIEANKACTQEAKLCPDGSYVSRTGQNCEFAKCPEAVGLADKITIFSPKTNEEISSPISVSGKARGTWFFEGSFPAEVHDSNDKLLGTATIEFSPESKEDTWMTENFVNFNGEISFSDPTTDSGYILFKKDNPSDQRELDESFKLQVNFKKLVYTNNEFRFKVTLPKGWEKYQVSVQKDKGDDKHTYIYFMMPTAEKSWIGSYDKNTGGVIPGMADIFVITANDLATWNSDMNSKECKENPNPSCPYEGSVIAKNSKYVFDASYGNGLLPPDVQKFRVGNSALQFLSGRFMFLD